MPVIIASKLLLSEIAFCVSLIPSFLKNKKVDLLLNYETKFLQFLLLPVPESTLFLSAGFAKQNSL